MSEPIADILIKIASVLHWLGKYNESRILTLLAKYCRANGLIDEHDIGGE